MTFSSAGTVDPDGDALRYAWDFNADGSVDSTDPNPTWTFQENGSYTPTVKVTDRTGRSAAATLPLLVGPRAPIVEFVSPVAGQPFQFGQTVAYQVKVTDDLPVDCSRVKVTDDLPVDCSRVKVTYVLGHDEHGHPLSSATGCSGTIATFVDGGHGGADNLTAVFVAEYTDAPTEPGVPPQTGTATVAGLAG
ncbi:PKD domain-containing protein [Micromonospora cremea]|uniref:PKD domain-containing protein n=1 Tax=Micromonospora cremea TaxID=709881 RepID=UPI001FCB366E|nr:PKD domain-containing protein [Micromonospora cremea]